jgi:hypothetical protein
VDWSLDCNIGHRDVPAFKDATCCCTQREGIHQQIRGASLICCSIKREENALLMIRNLNKHVSLTITWVSSASLITVSGFELGHRRQLASRSMNCVERQVNGK